MTGPHSAIWMFRPLLVLPACVALAIAAGCAGKQPVDETESTAERSAATADEGRLTRVIRPLDRILFVGDDLTQQMFYTQATGSALMALLPRYQLRIFNGGRNQATTTDAAEWLPGLLELTQPTVVFLQFGFRDFRRHETLDENRASFEEGLRNLIRIARQQSGVRQIIVLTPVPVATPLVEDAPPVGMNQTLAWLSQSSREVAEQEKVGWINLFDHTRAAWIAANASGGTPLTLGGELPTESGHIVLASIILNGLGVTGPMLERIGWSPLIPTEMARIRPVLAIRANPPTVRQASRSRDLYRQMLRHDEVFFRLWRLEHRNGRPADDRLKRMLASDEAWGPVAALALAYYGQGQPDPVFDQQQPLPPRQDEHEGL